MKDTPQNRYDAKNRVPIRFALNKKTDADVLAWLDGQGNKQGAVKALIRREIGRKVRVDDSGDEATGGAVAK